MIEFEHTIFVLLLLTGVLNAKPPQQRWGALIILVGILLVFIPPALPIFIPWNLIIGLVVPLLLWQNFRRIVNADWQGWKSLALWVASALIIGIALFLGGGLNWLGALLFGVIGASMIWRAGESESKSSYMSQVGPLALVFLLTEVEALVQSPNQYLGGIFSGASFGLLAALIALRLLKKTPSNYHFLIGIGQSYLAYWFSFFAGASAVSAVLVSVMVFIWLNQYSSLGFPNSSQFAPINTWPGFALILAVFLLLGLQGHQQISTIIILEAVTGAIAGISITWLGRKLNIPAFQKDKSPLMAGLRTGLLLLPALLLWPRDILEQPLLLAAALGLAIFVIGLSYMALLFYFPKTGVQKLEQ
jgi:hypothetical protein